eukprot:CAMPEP_0184719184 /NCGR_PEP_ID=MMETSP0314-20130426/8172_1 /TAXON_ID=38298 /ORGANISM="Rhodella maculata, Strain CCMP 736" /LENGTH=495 /DNA_ID=CAMNT_0027183039 /DNA_START=48 /DNA_END=1536 /DNA_ORIENTATION=+
MLPAFLSVSCRLMSSSSSYLPKGASSPSSSSASLSASTPPPRRPRPTRRRIDTLSPAPKQTHKTEDDPQPIDAEEDTKPSKPVFLAPFTEKEREKFRGSLLDWYARNHRALPWRTTPLRAASLPLPPQHHPGTSPYGVWVSEVMLQQTQVATVISYFNAWMKKFPTVADLANAELEEVNALWAGLGYYRRAALLHAGAKTVMKKHAGVLPSDVDGLRDINGVGEYTAGAIASIAFGRRVPAVDGNVIRVVTRLRAAGGEVRSARAVKALSGFAGELVDLEAAGDFNQAMMELGATVCTPKAPRCGECPVRKLCKGYSDGVAEGIKGEEYVLQFPEKAVKTKSRDENLATVVLHHAGLPARYMITKRPETGLLPGLWEFPSVVFDEEDDHRTTTERFLKKLLGLKTVPSSKTVGEVRHIFSHINQQIFVSHALLPPRDVEDLKESLSGNERMRWVSEDEFHEMGVSTQMKKVMKLFKEKTTKGRNETLDGYVDRKG